MNKNINKNQTSTSSEQASSGLTLEVRTPKAPKDLLERLAKLSLQYSTAKHLFHFVWLDGERACGVFGDGDNGAYEWFVYDASKGTLKVSDVGWGCTESALREVLTMEVDKGDDRETRNIKTYQW